MAIPTTPGRCSSGDARQRGPVLARLQAIAYGMHSGELVDTHRGTPVAEIGWREVERTLQVFGDHNPALELGLVQPVVQREELLTRSGLLLPRPGERAAFCHPKSRSCAHVLSATS